MEAFEKTRQNKLNQEFIDLYDGPSNSAAFYDLGWKQALENHLKIAEKYEKDCKTDGDFRVLYFHLKQVLKNEIGQKETPPTTP